MPLEFCSSKLDTLKVIGVESEAPSVSLSAVVLMFISILILAAVLCNSILRVCVLDVAACNTLNQSEKTLCVFCLVDFFRKGGGGGGGGSICEG